MGSSSEAHKNHLTLVRALTTEFKLPLEDTSTQELCIGTFTDLVSMSEPKPKITFLKMTMCNAKHQLEWCKAHHFVTLKQ